MIQLYNKTGGRSSYKSPYDRYEVEKYENNNIDKMTDFTLFSLDGWPGRIFHYPVLTSTNTWLASNLRQKPSPFKNFDVVWTDYQSEGRGRGQRQWIAPRPKEGKVLTFSIILPITDDSIKKANNREEQSSLLTKIGSLPQVAAWTWVTLMRELGASVTLKWPNDILFQEKKLAGLLAETIQVNENLSMVLGMGINLLFTPEFLTQLTDHIGRKVTSLVECLPNFDQRKNDPHASNFFDPRMMLETFLKKFYPVWELWQAEGLPPFIESWKYFSDLIGRRIIFIRPEGGREEARVEDILTNGHLLVKLMGPNGERETISFGEIEY